ncbi:MAG: DUF4082 domain-containing protein [Bacteroidota bacterium]|nr:DUF4082 domain-containing protein [Bacteroidota bacterium]
MKKTIGLLKTIVKPGVFTLLWICLPGISCKKEQSAVAPPSAGPITIFTRQIPPVQTANDKTGGIELGVKFQSLVDGKAEGVRFYKTPGNTGLHTAQLYSSDGTLLASKRFINETDSGWQFVLFDTIISITANTTYIAAYHSSLGNYISTVCGLKTEIINGPLTALADGEDGINGLYKYTNTPDLPDSGYNASDYWVDILFVPSPWVSY